MYLFKHYLQVIVRTAGRNKRNFAISLIGLTFGFSSSILIFQFNSYEQSYDKFHEKTDQIFRIQNNVISSETKEVLTKRATTFYGIYGTIENEIPEVVRSAQLLNVGGNLAIGDKILPAKNAAYVSASLLEMLSIHLLEGDKKSLDQPGSIYISQSMARTIFGSDNAYGRRIKFIGNGPNQEYDLEVNGIYEDFSENSYFDIEIMISRAEFINYNSPNLAFNPNFTIEQVAWRWVDFHTFIELGKGADEREVQQKVSTFFRKYRAEIDKQNGRDQAPIIQNIGDIHTMPAIDSELKPPTDVRFIQILYLIGILILAIAFVNYMNISYANVFNKAKDIGVRKALGAHKSQLMIQLLSESFLIAILSLALSVFIILMIAPQFADFIDKPIFEFTINSFFVWLIFAICCISGTILAGLYPALVLTNLKSQLVLKGSFKSTKTGNILRKVLLAFQFIIVCSLLSMSFSIYQQLDFMINSGKGFISENKVIVNLPDQAFREANYDVQVEQFAHQLSESKTVKSVTGSSVVPGIPIDFRSAAYLQGNDEQESVYMSIMVVSPGFLEDYEVKILMGRDFDKNLISDYENKAIINKKAVESFGLPLNEDAIGVKLELFGNQTFKVIGIIDDYHQVGLHSSIEPLVIQLDSLHNHGTLTVNISGPTNQAIIDIEDYFREVFPSSPISYNLLNESYKRLYEQDQKFQQIFTFFTLLAIALSLIGLYGLAIFFSDQRKKEVSVRKVHGASSGSILRLLIKDYIYIVLISGIIAVPIAHNIVETWIQNYAYRIESGILVYVVPVLVIMIIVVLTIGSRLYNLANINPTLNLRIE